MDAATPRTPVRRAFRTPALLGAVLLSLALGGCDTFSLTDLLVLQGQNSEPLSISAAVTTIPRNSADSVALAVQGGTPPYSFVVAAEDLYAGTSSESIGGVYNSAYEAGGAIGRMEITVTDAVGGVERVYIEVVPQTPSLTLAPWTPKTGGNLYWSSADGDVLTEYVIDRSVDGGSFTSWQSIDAPADQTYDQNLTPSSTYSYRIYAVAGEYYSLPDEATM